jgi:RNA polymerase sigma-70 factor (ECF subfamily)
MAGEGFRGGAETFGGRTRLIKEWAPRVDRDERDLVRRCLEQDEAASTRLVQEHAQMVGTVVWRATGDRNVVEDLAQETFFRVFRGLGCFDGRAKLSTWIYTIAHRVAIDHLRKECADASRNTLQLPDLPPRLDPEQAAAHGELDRIVHDQLSAMPDKYRLPLVYAAIEELDYETIGMMLKVRPATVKTLAFRGRQMLRQRVEAVLRRRGGGSRAI